MFVVKNYLCAPVFGNFWQLTVNCTLKSHEKSIDCRKIYSRKMRPGIYRIKKIDRLEHKSQFLTDYQHKPAFSLL